MKKTTTPLILAILYCVLFANTSAAQNIFTIAGNGTGGYTGNGGQATAAEINQPRGAVTFDASGNIYFADQLNNSIRKVTSLGIISLIAGCDTNGYSGDGGPATAAKLNYPEAVALDAAGNVYIADFDNNHIRKVSPAGIISNFAGNGINGFSGDGGQATAAEIQYPSGLAFDATGNFYFSDAGANRIRKITTSGIITTVAGNGTASFSGDGGQATAATLNQPDGVSFDASGNMYIADNANARIRKVTPSGIISTIAGNGTQGFTGDGAQATAAELHGPLGGVVSDASGNLYIADFLNNRIRMINTSGIINSVAGNGTAGFTGDGGPATAAEINGPTGVAFDATGNLYISDQYNSRIRIISAPTVTVSVNTPAAICPGATVTLTASGNATTYSWTPATGLSTTIGTTVTASPSVTTVYTVTGTSSYIKNGITLLSTGKTSSTVTVNAVILTVNSPTICPTGNTTTLTASGANTYTWSPATGISATSGASVAANPSSTTVYTLSGTNTSACTSTMTTTVTIASTISVTVNSTSYCEPGGTGVLTAHGATNYIWTPSAGLSATTGASVTTNTTSATTYTITGTTGTCSATATSIVTVYFPPSITTASTPPACNGSCNGSATVTVMTGSPPYTYNWTPMGGTLSTVTNLCAGSYNIVVHDVHGCFTSGSVNLIQPTLLTASVISQSVTCNGGTNGSATVTAGGGTAPYTYLWSPSGGTATTASNLAAGAYTAKVTDNKGCIATTNTTIAQPAPLVIPANSPTICMGSTATLTASGATTYTWNTGATGATITPSPTLTTTYTLSGTNAVGCIGTGSSTVTVTNFNNLSGTIYDTTTVSGLHPITNGMVYLYRQQPGGSVAIDTSSHVVPTNTLTGSYTFIGVPPGTYYVKAVASITTYTGSIATYLSAGPNAFLWSSATALSHSGCANGNDAGHDISIIEIPAQTGTGIISGNITGLSSFGHRLANGNNSVMGTPVRGVDVKLGKNPAGGCANRTTTDGNGNYSFTNVNAGAYSIYADIPNFGITTILTTTINPSNLQSTGNNYCVDSVTINTNCSQTTGIQQIALSSSQVLVYPNPSKGSFIIETTAAMPCTLYDINGREVFRQTINGKTLIDVSSLTDGVYNLSILSNEAVINKRIIITK